MAKNVKYRLIRRDGSEQEFARTFVAEAAKEYWNEVYNVEGEYIPELHKIEDGKHYRLATDWARIRN